MWFKNAIIYRIPQYWTIPDHVLSEGLNKHLDCALGPTESVNCGWVNAHDGQLVFAQNEHLLLKMRTNKKLLPASVVKKAVDEAVKRIEEDQGYKPGRKQQKEIKQEMIEKLLPKAFVVYKEVPVWIDTRKGWLVVGTSSTSDADAAVSLLLRSVEQLPLETLYVSRPIASTLTEWLSTGDAPESFTVDQDAVLAEKGTSAKVKYSKHSLDGQDLQVLLSQGKQCTQLALTWKDRVSFVLTEKTKLSKIEPLDVIQEEREQNEDAFGSDFALMTGELSKLIDSLIEAFGGLAKQEKEAA